MNLEEILKAKGSKVYTIGPDAVLEQVVARLVDHNVGSLVVCDRDVEKGERPIGIVTERDILHACSPRSGHVLATTRVDQVMSTNLSIASPADAVENVMGLMTKKRIRHLPVLHEGRLVGLVSIGDIVKAQHDQLALENRFMKDYIHKG
jgi:CBS domain-containing protein